MNYKLKNKSDEPNIDLKSEKKDVFFIIKKFLPFIKPDLRILIISCVLILLNSISNVIAPFLLGKGVDEFFGTKDFNQVIIFSIYLGIVYIIALTTGYLQSLNMGTLGQNVLFRLRNTVFGKLQNLPLEFFNENKSGDLISRINSDTEKLNQLFSEILIRLIGGIFTLIGIGIFIIFINWKLALVTLSAAFVLFIYTKLISPWIESRNKKSLSALGDLSAEIQENLSNFKVIVAFNRRDYFYQKFDEVNNINYKYAVKAGISNNINGPVYDFASNIAQLSVLLFGMYLITQGEMTLGVLISFNTYALNFYNPLRQIASLFASIQVSLAAWKRIDEILSLENNLIIEDKEFNKKYSDKLIVFENVSFGYNNKKPTLENINLKLEEGKKYAFVGPTGGGKTTTASLIARLFDPIAGNIYFKGYDLKSYSREELSNSIGFILQEPFLFSGTLFENIVYGNRKFEKFSEKELETILQQKGFESILDRFVDGLKSKIDNNSENISLGQKQLIAFLRAVLREPQILILDEATANIDTITELQLQQIIDNLPSNTTIITIAHRLNTIENADEIFFVNNRTLTPAGNLQHAIEMIESARKSS